MAVFVTAAAVAMSLFHLYAAYEIVRTEVLRAVHVAFVLFLCFLVYPAARRYRHRAMWWDWGLGALGIATAAYLIAGGDDFMDRSILPNAWDIVFGVVLVVLVLEASGEKPISMKAMIDTSDRKWNQYFFVRLHALSTRSKVTSFMPKRRTSISTITNSAR